MVVFHPAMNERWVVFHPSPRSRRIPAPSTTRAERYLALFSSDLSSTAPSSLSILSPHSMITVSRLLCPKSSTPSGPASGGPSSLVPPPSSSPNRLPAPARSLHSPPPRRFCQPSCAHRRIAGTHTGSVSLSRGAGTLVAGTTSTMARSRVWGRCGAGWPSLGTGTSGTGRGVSHTSLLLSRALPGNVVPVPRVAATATCASPCIYASGSVISWYSSPLWSVSCHALSSSRSAPAFASLSAASFSSIPVCPFHQIAWVGCVCAAARSTSVCSAGRMRWLYCDGRNSVFCHTCSPCSNAFASQPHHTSWWACSVSTRSAPPASAWYASALPSTPNPTFSPSPCLYARPAPSDAFVCPLSSCSSFTDPSEHTTMPGAVRRFAPCPAAK
eukprot:3048412-Rhodomonas_salina.1